LPLLSLESSKLLTEERVELALLARDAGGL
jgi:hypothetical protein